MKKLLFLFLGAAMLFAACQQTTDSADSHQIAVPSEENSTAPTVDATIPENREYFTDRDRQTGYEAKVATLQFSGSQVTGDTDAVRVSDSAVTICDEGTYVLSGSYTGTVIIDAENTAKLQLVLQNFTATGTETAPLYILQADKVFVTLEGQNALIGPESFMALDENNVDGAVFSKADLTFNGQGELAVTCPVAHGIVAKDDLVFCGGSYTVNCASHGIQANDSVRIENGSFSITSGKDGIHAENDEDGTLGYIYIEDGTFDISAEGDGISAGAWMQITDGQYRIVTGGGSENGNKASSDNYGGFMGGPGGRGPGDFGGAMTDFGSTQTDTDSTSIKGLKAAGEMALLGGSFDFNCADDAIHSNLKITVHGGTYQLATGDDGMHADEALTIENGNITVTESYEGLEGLNISICGGEIKLNCSDDGINAAGGNDQSGFGGGRGDMFGGGKGGRGPGGMGGMGGSSNGSIVISGGTIYMNASGDGIDANGSLTITGGNVIVCGPTQGDTAVLDYDNSATITGGTFIGTGSQMMAQSFTDSSQGVLALSMGGTLRAGTAIAVTDAEGNVLLEYAPALDYAILILSTPEMEKGQAYTVTIDGTSQSFKAN